MQEKLSLADPLWRDDLLRAPPSQKEYITIARELARRFKINMDEEDSGKGSGCLGNEAWGDFPGRTAQQFINHLCGSMHAEPGQTQKTR